MKGAELPKLYPSGHAMRDSCGVCAAPQWGRSSFPPSGTPVGWSYSFRYSFPVFISVTMRWRVDSSVKFSSVVALQSWRRSRHFELRRRSIVSVVGDPEFFHFCKHAVVLIAHNRYPLRPSVLPSKYSTRHGLTDRHIPLTVSVRTVCPASRHQRLVSPGPPRSPSTS